jgi:RNA polymerase sigma-70 factor (ECF subfamily)
LYLLPKGVSLYHQLKISKALTSLATFRLTSLLNGKAKQNGNAPSEDLTLRSEQSDEVLMAHICEGDNEALGFLFRRYGRTVRRIAFRVLRDWSEADDLLQDIFISIYRLCRTYDSSKSPVRFWIFRMTVCRAISRRRYLSSRHFYTRLDIDAAASHLADSQTHTHQLDEFIDTNLNNGNLAKFFSELSENQRQTLRLYFVDGYTLEEIAAKLGQTRGNIKNHYFRGLDKLRRLMFLAETPGGSRT